ncbi:uncharacterized protein K444DRAFT_523524 [Hyaloscypha bicolor E]|uniref:Zinc finger PHD-type domain-containing protein n=1 Tax=Hyaloscypha bicolor E TaxID=1095630 RepID=A0A2J6TK10_9HELO|nr:uncharacterized protein K444DRAFT_523524 [Hyaloscypha bicolor E]PMD63326.1 hypothetical protein K444DRAFT_523524 [Hyaloscypha bicolor E]
MDTSRRSSRAARASQSLQSSHHSSASSNSSGRADRATRSHQKTGSPRKSTPSGSLSSEPPEDTITTAAVEDTIQTRRKRGRADEREKSSKVQAVQVETTNGTEEVGEDDEAVRCICGFDEYPGPPQLGDEDSKHGVREGIEEPIITVADVTEDLAGFFLQCDVCKVWQHGGCVGIMNEDTSPEEYFCEECRKDLHKIFTAPNGQRYSHYLPLYQSLSRTTSRAASFSKDGTRSPRGSKSGRPSSSLQSAKRRSTMNSRDAAYDEEEQLRRAIEASKGEKSGESTDGGTRRGKRGRSESEDKLDGVKRQRTSSVSPSPSGEPHQFASQADSDDGTAERPTVGKKIRGAAARNHKEKAEREERERSRQEAANKRKGRAERRRIDDPSEELPLATRVMVTKTTEDTAQPLDPPSSSQVAAPDTPPQSTPSTSHRKGGRPPNPRKGKLGKNQYTKDRDQLDGEDPSPNRSQSRDVPRGDDSGQNSGNKGPGNEGSKSGKSKSASKITMSDMKKRVAAILDFITRTQFEMAGESMSLASGEAPAKMIRNIADGLPMIKVNGDKRTEGSKEGEAREVTANKEFKDLSCLEMMDVLTRQLVKWQKEFAT